MSKFDKAVHIVHEALTRMQESGGKELRASKDSLAKLINTKSPPRSPATSQVPAEKKPAVVPAPSPAAASPRA